MTPPGEDASMFANPICDRFLLELPDRHDDLVSLYAASAELLEASGFQDESAALQLMSARTAEFEKLYPGWSVEGSAQEVEAALPPEERAVFEQRLEDLAVELSEPSETVNSWVMLTCPEVYTQDEGELQELPNDPGSQPPPVPDQPSGVDDPMFGS